MNKNKGGRPPLPEDRRRSQTLGLRVTESEHQRVLAAAEAAGQSYGELLRRALDVVLTTHQPDGVMRLSA